MDEKKEKLVISGNAFYEIDLDCVRKKEEERKQKAEKQEGKIRNSRKNESRKH